MCSSSRRRSRPFSTRPNRRYETASAVIARSSCDEAIQTISVEISLDCFASLAMTRRERLNLLLLHPARNVVRLPDRQRDDGQRRIARGAAGELAAVGDEQ